MTLLCSFHLSNEVHLTFEWNIPIQFKNKQLETTNNKSPVLETIPETWFNSKISDN